MKTKTAPVSQRLMRITICSAVLLVAPTGLASEPRVNVIRAQSSDLNCAAEDMQEEIKVHFRGTRCYRKLLGINSQIQTRSAAVLRRIDRNPCYRGMDRDIAKLNELACELNEAYKTAMAKSGEGVGRPVVGGTEHVVDKLTGMLVLADGLKATSLSILSTSNPVPDLIYPQILADSGSGLNQDVAPGVPSVSNEHRLRPEYVPALPLETQTPTRSAPEPVFRSVLEK